MAAPQPAAPTAPDAGTMADFNRYLGAWVLTDGEIAVKCSSSMVTEVTTAMGETFQVQRGADTAFVILEYPCTWKVDIMGNEAWLRAGQTCSGITSRGDPLTYVLVGGRLTPILGSTGKLAFEISVSESEADVRCSRSMNGNAVKQPGCRWCSSSRRRRTTSPSWRDTR